MTHSPPPAAPLHPSRRALLRAALLGAGASLLPRAAAALATVPRCAPTGEDIEGPYYLPGAPVRTSLLEPGMEGLPLELSGQIRTAACEPLAGARLELWQCDARGNYDTRGTRLRATLHADSAGRFALRTIVPGRYLNGPTYRPAHLHLKVRAPGRRGRVLTTQLYFRGDPYNAGDPWYRAERALALVAHGGGYRARFDPTLAV